MAAASGAASVRVWHITSRGWDLWTERPLSEVVRVAYPLDFMMKDSQRFADSGGWGWAVFKYEAASSTFTPGTKADVPPQGNDAKCGFACHTIVQQRDYVFTDYGRR